MHPGAVELPAAAPTESKPFIHKLYTMVCNPATSDILGWSSDGSAIVIIELEKFVSELLPLYFKHTNLSSFVRQLNTYGFSKTDSSAWRFAHPDFRRGQPERLHLIQRKSSHRQPAASAAHGSSSQSVADEQTGEEQAATYLAGSALPHVQIGGPLSLTVSQPASVQPLAPPVASGSQVSVMRDLENVRAQSGAMMARIIQLQSQVHEAQSHQSSTRESIGKIMTFLSRVYTDHRITGPGATVGVVGAQPVSTMPLQQPVIGPSSGGSTADTLPPPTLTLSVQEPPVPPAMPCGPAQCVSERVSSASTVAAAASAAGLPPLHPMAPHLPTVQDQLSRGNVPHLIVGSKRMRAPSDMGEDRLSHVPRVLGSVAHAAAQQSQPPAAPPSMDQPPLEGTPRALPPVRSVQLPTWPHTQPPLSVSATDACADVPHAARSVSASSSVSLSANCGLPTLGTCSAAAPIVLPAATGVPPTAAAAASASLLPPSVLRDKSIGAQVAKALPNELRSLALELVESTELQDETIAEVKEVAKEADCLSDPGSRQGSPSPEELESYLWDFLETSQALDEAKDLAEAVNVVYET